MNDDSKEWIKSNWHKFKGPVGFNRDDYATLFAIFSEILGEERKSTGCGRCIKEAKDTVHYWAKNNLGYV